LLPEQPDLLIADFQVPNTDTFDIIGYLLARDEHFKILIYSLALKSSMTANGYWQAVP